MPRVKEPFVDSYRPRLRILIDPVLEERFNRFIEVQPNGCIFWIGGCSSNGYGVISKYLGNNKYKNYGCHRIALEGGLGRPLRPGMSALHTCDNRPCVNPEHLYEGTQQRNMMDRVERGRVPSRYACRTLDDAQVRQIRQRTITQSQYAVAQEFGVSRSVVLGILNGTKYKDVK